MNFILKLMVWMMTNIFIALYIVQSFKDLVLINVVGYIGILLMRWVFSVGTSKLPNNGDK